MDDLTCGVCGAAWRMGAAFCARCSSSVAQAEPTLAPLAPTGPAVVAAAEPPSAGAPPPPVCPQCGSASPRGAQRCLSCFAPLVDATTVREPGFVVEFPWGARLLREGDRLLVGRAYESEVVDEVSRYPDVSRRHAELRLCDGTLMVRDLGSTNGTFRNGTRLDPATDAELRAGDRLRFGLSLMAGVADGAPG